MMRGCTLAGMLVGGIVGSAVTLAVLPYCKPQLNNFLQQSKRCIDEHIDRMEY